MRRRLVAASIALASLTLGACGSDSDEPKATPSSAAPVADADGWTAEQREVLDRVDAFLAATYGRGTQPVASTAKGIVTEAYLAELVQSSRTQIDGKGLKWLGPYSVEAGEVEVDGDEASVEACLDLTAVFLVPKGDKAAGAGSTNIGEVVPALYRLEKSGDTWVVSATERPESTC